MPSPYEVVIAKKAIIDAGGIVTPARRPGRYDIIMPKADNGARHDDASESDLVTLATPYVIGVKK
jgi:hypothetical protein